MRLHTTPTPSPPHSIIWVKKLNPNTVDMSSFDGNRQAVNRLLNERAMTTKGSLKSVLSKYSATKPKGFRWGVCGKEA